MSNVYANAILAKFAPEQAASVLQERLARAKAAHDAISDWLRERARIEEHYSNELDKLSQRMPIPDSELGTFATPWNDVTRTVRETSRGAKSFVRKLRTEIEPEVRQVTSNSAGWNQARMAQGRLVEIAQKVSSSEDHVGKNARRSSSKQEAAGREAQQARTVWETQAPELCDAIERVDEERFVKLKDVLTAYETLEMDRSQASIKGYERAIQSLIQFEPKDEVQSFAAQVIGGEVRAPEAPSSTSAASRVFSHHSGHAHALGADTAANGVGGGRQAHHDDASSVVSKGSTGKVKLRSKVGSIFRSKKKANRPASSGLRSETVAETPSPISSSGSVPSRQASTMPPDFGPTRERTERENLSLDTSRAASNRNVSVGSADSATSPGGNKRMSVKPAPPPSRKATALGMGGAGTTGATGPEANGQRPSERSGGSSGFNIPGGAVAGTAAGAVAAAAAAGAGIAAAGRGSQQNANAATDEGDDLYENGQDQRNRFNIAIKKDAIREGTNDEDDVALSTLASNLRARSTISGRNARGRREIQSRLFTGIEPTKAEEPMPEGFPGSAGTSPQSDVPSDSLLSQLQHFPGQSGQANAIAEEPSVGQQGQQAFQFSQPQQFQQSQPAQQMQPPQGQTGQAFDRQPEGTTGSTFPYAGAAAGAAIGAAAGLGAAASHHDKELPSVPADEPTDSSVQNSPENLSTNVFSTPQNESVQEFQQGQQSQQSQQFQQQDEQFPQQGQQFQQQGQQIPQQQLEHQALQQQLEASSQQHQPAAAAQTQPQQAQLPRSPAQQFSQFQQPAQQEQFQRPPTGETQPVVADTVSDLPPPRAPFAPQFTGSGISTADTRSIRSSQSSVAAVNRHPDLPMTAGLVASVLEVLSATLKDGHIVNSSRIGEIALGYNGQPTEEPLQLRVAGNNKYIERIAPNGAVVQPAGADSTYNVNTQALATAHGITAFKYQTTEGWAPLVFVPIWRIESNQSSLMLTYRLADDFPLDSAEISGLTIVVPVEGGQATSAQSKPVASFSRDHQRITWRFNEPVIVKRGVEERLLCRFLTQGTTVEGSAGIDIRFRIANLPLSNLVLETTGADDPFGDATNGSTAPVNAIYTAVGARYIAHAESNVQRRL